MFTDDYGGRVKFLPNGDGVGVYNLFNYRRNRANNMYEYLNVGNWSVESGLTMKSHEPVTWPSGLTHVLPTSRCSEPCAVGHVMQVSEILLLFMFLLN